MANFLLTDDLTDHLGNLPDWYVQILEEREKNACDLCPDNWIEITLEDFDGNPIKGEPYFVFTESTDGNAIALPSPEGGPFTNGAGQTTPVRLPLINTATVVDIAFGVETLRTTNLTDHELGIDYDEQLYLEDMPVTYDGPLSIPSTVSQEPDVVAFGYLREVIAAYEAGVPNDALQDMLGEIDTALRAALGLFPDLSLTVRNDAEHKLIMGMQMVPENAHLSPHVTPMYQDALLIFNDRRETMPFSHFFVGPDGVAYEDPHGDVIWGADEESSGWLGIGEMLDQIRGYSGSFDLYANSPREQVKAFKTRITSAIRERGYRVAGPVNIPRNRIAGGNGSGGPDKGKGQNPRQRALGRHGYITHAQLHARRRVKINGALKFKGITIRFNKRFHEHMDPGHGVKGSRISGAHTPSAFKKAVRDAGGEYRSLGTHPADQRIKYYQYRLPRKNTGELRPWADAQEKTVYKMSKEEFMTNVKQALRNSIARPDGPFKNMEQTILKNTQKDGSISNIEWKGTTLNGIEMLGYIKPINKYRFDTISAFFIIRNLK